MYPKQIFHPDGRYRVVFGPEEHRQLKAEGWSDEAEPGKVYRVWTATPEPVPVPLAAPEVPQRLSRRRSVEPTE